MRVVEDQTIRRQLTAAFPGCPERDVRRFCRLLAETADSIASRATMVLDKPYGRNHLLVTEGPFGLSFACIEPGQSTSLHFHARRREFFCVRQGEMRLTSDDRSVLLCEGEVGESVPFVPHALGNDGPTQLQVLELFSPALLDDKVRVSDRYDRVLGAVGLHE